MSNQIGTLKMGQKFKKTPAGDIPVDWECSKLSDIANINMGQSPESSSCNDEERGIPFYQGNADFGRIYPTPASWCQSPTKVAAKGDILISVRAPVGEVNIAPHECCIGRGLSAIRANGIDAKYLYYSLISSSRAMDKLAQGSTFKAINGGDLSSLAISLPTAIAEQEEVGEILWSVDDLIGKTTAEIDKNKELKKGLMRQLLTRGIAHKKFKKTEIGEIPENWGIVAFGDVFSFLRNGSNSRDELSDSGDVGYVHYGDLHTKWQTKLDCSTVDFPKIEAELVGRLPFLENGDLIVADASEDYAGVGVSVEISNVGEHKIVAGLHTMLLRDKAKTFVDGFRGYIQYIPAVHNSLVKVATGGSVYGISKGNIQSVKIPCPPHREQEQIKTILAELDSKLQNQGAYLEKISRLKSSLMSVLLAGKVRV